MTQQQIIPTIEEDGYNHKLLLARAVEEKRKRIRENGIAYYTPQDQQDPFHRSTKRIRSAFGANRSGKTVSGACEGVWYSTGTHPYKDIPVPNYGRVVCTDFTNGIEKVVLPEFKKWFPKDRLIDGSWSKSYHKETRTLTTIDGSTVEFMSYDQEVSKFSGASRHWTWFDEEPPHSIYDECRMRLIDTKGDIWITMTPDKGMTWVYSEIYEKAGLDPDIEVFTYGIYDNPYIDNEEIDMIKRGLSEGLIEAKIYGKFIRLSGLIYRVYNDDRHTMNRFPIPSHWPKVQAIDPHPRISTAALYLAVAPQDQFRRMCKDEGIILPQIETSEDIYIVYDEIFPSDPPLISQMAELMHAHEGNGHIMYRLIDNSANTPDPIMGTTIRQEFAKHGIRTVLADKDVSNRIFKVRSKLQNNTLFFFNDLQETLWQVRHYAWDDYKSNQDFKDLREKPKKKRDHMMDNLGYICLSSPGYHQPGVYRPARSTVCSTTGY